MRKLIEFTKNWKYRNLLHIVGGFLIGSFLSLLFVWYVSLGIVFIFANYWEYSQKKHFGAKYSLSDILLTALGGLLSVWLLYYLN